MDADNQTAQDVFVRLCNMRNIIGEERMRHIYLIDPSSDTLFAYDSFFTRLTGRLYDDWLAGRVEFVGKILARKQGLDDFKDQMRRERVLFDVLYMLGTRKANGKHFGLGRAIDAIQFGSKPWERMFNEVADYLPYDVAQNLFRLHHTNYGQRQREVESTENILRSFLRGRVKDIVSGNAPSIDARWIVRNRGVVLVKLGSTPLISREQCDAIGAMLNNEFIEANWHDPEPFYIVIEEACQMLRSDTAEILRTGRKHNCRLVITAQDPSSLENKYVSMLAPVMSECDLKLIGSVPWESKDIAEHFLGKVVNTELNWKPMDRPAGHQVVTLTDTSKGVSTQQTWTNGNSLVHTNGNSSSFTHGSSDSRGNSENWSFGESEGHSENAGRTLTKGDGYSANETRESATGSQSEGRSESSGRTRGKTRGYSRGENGSHSDNHSFGRSVNAQTARGRTGSNGGSVSETFTESNKSTHLPITREEWYASGLLYPIEAQLWAIKRMLATLPPRHFVLSYADKQPIIFRAHTILDQEPCDMDLLLDWMYSIHPCYFIPGEVEKWSLPPQTKNSSNGSTTHKPSKKSQGTNGRHTEGSNGSKKKGSSS
jgi:hypothetical protein